jgi:hypothetical protein
MVGEIKSNIFLDRFGYNMDISKNKTPKKKKEEGKINLGTSKRWSLTL